ncbi:hypothetical protein [Saccharothrix hoggarensis]|uniref:Uncharacterized protein n=1 Tax=Saccharothrix hoggarensis TaxID=913853 RepID=A0ABW3QUU9_9PSEU
MTTFANTEVVKIFCAHIAPRNDQWPADEDRLRAIDLEEHTVGDTGIEPVTSSV